MEKFSIQKYDELFEAILLLESVEECRGFFEDLCTIKELKDLSLRLEVASMLREGRSYQEVTKETGVSAATICRVNKCLMYGEGYKKVLVRLDGDNK